MLQTDVQCLNLSEMFLEINPSAFVYALMLSKYLMSTLQLPQVSSFSTFSGRKPTGQTLFLNPYLQKYPPWYDSEMTEGRHATHCNSP